jgi:hypothetical protein
LDLLPLVDRSGIKLDAEGNVTGVAEAFAAMKEKKPEWFKAQVAIPDPVLQQQQRSTGKPTPTPAPAPGAVNKEAIMKMTDPEYKAWKKTQLSGLSRH